MDNPIKKQTMQTSPMNISRRFPTLRWFGKKSTIAVTNPSTPTNWNKKKQ